MAATSTLLDRRKSDSSSFELRIPSILICMMGSWCGGWGAAACGWCGGGVGGGEGGGGGDGGGVAAGVGVVGVALWLRGGGSVGGGEEGIFMSGVKGGVGGGVVEGGLGRHDWQIQVSLLLGGAPLRPAHDMWAGLEHLEHFSGRFDRCLAIVF